MLLWAPTNSPHRPKQPYAVPYPACQPANQLDLDHHSSPFSSSQHNTAQQLHAVSNEHVDQPPCLSTVSPHHCVSHKCRRHSSSSWPSCSCLAVGHIHLPKPTHDDEHRIDAFVSRPLLRILSRDRWLVLHRLPLHLSPATLVSTLASISPTRVIFATRVLAAAVHARGGLAGEHARAQ